jgi:hypothetical protein
MKSLETMDGFSP